jgi:hypothetical protein
VLRISIAGSDCNHTDTLPIKCLLLRIYDLQFAIYHLPEETARMVTAKPTPPLCGPEQTRRSQAGNDGLLLELLCACVRID